MSRKIGVLVFAHGSRLKAGNDAVVRFAAELRRQLGHPQVEAAFMELGRPLLPTAIKKLVADGCTHIHGCALFLVPGAHLGEDVPFIFTQTLKKHPGVTWEIGPALLEDPAMVASIAQRLRRVIAS
jgi:sirohydrochlorin cobaltochelatase